MDGNLMDRQEQVVRTPGKGRRTASRILDCAEELFAQQGYGATSLRDIAARAGLQQPGLYKHFSGKDDLYRQVYERALQPMADLMDGHIAGADGGFDKLTDRMTELLALHPNIARLLLRAIISSDAEPDHVALGWLDRLVGYGRKLNAKADVISSDSLLALQIVAIFNMLFGFFWASPLIESLAGESVGKVPMMEMQKKLLRQFISGLSDSPISDFN